ncbi:alanine racemase [Amphiplicatus metriothermophilus]|uniref:Alanine racemase n=1 Tax=Amphiplicatus metriothermophilus TaxID=1519374 RepID=A0A239PYH9_9PROT|nr:alanine racemase [Amphiplicatus metriothermophilus]MBB5519866.1 alanine racemase [Amphiplicatus metriothermophilus]SNT75083.1 alanine racemase [Amphiplicatus metriothermophilus]
MSPPARDDFRPPATRPLVEIDLDALCANFRTLAAASAGATPAAVVKCDGYGLGAAPVAQALAIQEKCRTFFVAYPHEGARLRAALARCAPHATIYVFNGPHEETLAAFDAHRLIPVVNSLEQARLWARARPGAPAALHADTGMNRLGAPAYELDDIAALDGLSVVLVLSHLACSSDPPHEMNPRQRALFEKAAARFPGAARSLAASSGALLPASYHFELTRLGVGLYGVSPLDIPDGRIAPVARLTAPVIQLRNVAAGESVGYARAHVFDAPRRLATLALGYGDGLPRIIGDRGAAFLGGARCPIVGRVSMDLAVLDVTEAPEPVRLGDRAELFGPRLPIEETAAACMTIGYELLTSLGGRVPRRYLWRAAPAGWRAPDDEGM